MIKTTLIACNWKMHHNQKETQDFFTELQSDLSALNLTHLKILLFPPLTSLETAQKVCLHMPSLSIGAQNAHWEKKGAFTGEISGPMLHELGIRTVLIGHSERRLYFGETDASAKKRAESLLQQGFQIVFCIGETLQERQNQETFAVLSRQLAELLPPDHSEPGLKTFLDGRLIFAYEPVWAIGTGIHATSKEIQEVHTQIRALIQERAGDRAAASTPLLYGGSVNPGNTHEILSCPHVDGALIGGASLKAPQLLEILRIAKN